MGQLTSATRTSWVFRMIGPMTLAGLIGLGGISAVQAGSLELGTSGGNSGDTGEVSRGPFLIPVCCGGTLGALIQNGSTRYIISNRHVLAPVGSISLDIVSPGLIDTDPVCTGAATTVGTLSFSVPRVPFVPAFPLTTLTAADAAMAMEFSDPFLPDGDIANIGPINGQLNVTVDDLGKSVMKQGRSSDLTFGTIAEVMVTVDIASGDGCGSETTTDLRYADQIYVTKGKFGEAGDSGAVVMTTQTAAEANEPTPLGVQAIGMLFAGDNGGAFINLMADVLAALEDESTISPLSLVTGANTSTLVAEGGGGGGGGGGGQRGPPPDGPPGRPNAAQAPAGFEHAMAVKETHTPDLFDSAGVVAVGLGIDENGEPVIIVHLESAIADTDNPIPSSLEGVSVRTRITGRPVLY